MLGEARTPRVLLRVRGCSWQVGPTAAAGAGTALVSGVRAVLPGPAASAGLPGSAGLLSIIPAASSEPSPEHKLPGRCRGEVGWRGAAAGSFNGGCAEPHRPPAAGQQERHARSPASGITSGAGGWSGHRSGAFREVKERNSGLGFFAIASVRQKPSNSPVPA